MKIAIITAGNVGGTLGTRWVQKGHPVVFGVKNPQDDKVRALVAKAPGTRAAVVVDAAAGSEVLQAYREAPRAILIGSRDLANDSFRSTFARRFGGRAIAWSLNRLFAKCRVTDPTSGMRLMDRSAIALFASRYPHDFPEPISLAWALKDGLSVGECAVQMRAREHGSSSIVGLKPLAYMFRVLGYVVLARLSRGTRTRQAPS